MNRKTRQKISLYIAGSILLISLYQFIFGVSETYTSLF